MEFEAWKCRLTFEERTTTSPSGALGEFQIQRLKFSPKETLTFSMKSARGQSQKLALFVELTPLSDDYIFTYIFRQRTPKSTHNQKFDRFDKSHTYFLFFSWFPSNAKFKFPSSNFPPPRHRCVSVFLSLFPVPHSLFRHSFF